MTNLIETNNKGITTEFSPITIDSVGDDKFKKDFYSVQLRQAVKVTYPSAGGGSDKSDSIMDMLDDVASTGKSYDKTRMHWDLFPKQRVNKETGEIVDVTPEEVLAKYNAVLAANPKAKIRQELANDVTLVLNDKQLSAIASDEVDYDLAKAEETHIIKDAEGNIVQPVQYRSTQLSFSGEADLDMRTVVSVEDVAASTVENALTA